MEKKHAQALTAVGVAVLGGATALVPASPAAAGDCWPWDTRIVQVINYAGNPMKGSARLCPNGNPKAWSQEETNVLEQGGPSWPPVFNVCDTQGMAQWARRNGDLWGERYSTFQSNCAGVRQYNFPSMNHPHMRETGVHFKFKSRGTDNQFKSIGKVYR
jgi:hypothetical protein